MVEEGGGHGFVLVAVGGGKGVVGGLGNIL